MAGYPNPPAPRSFWRDAFAWRHAVTAQVLPSVAVFAVHGALVAYLHRVFEWEGLAATHVSFAGGALVLLLVLRTNGGYERWWEARKLWGGIVNQSRNFAVKVMAYGPPGDQAWRERMLARTAAFPHVCRRSLRGQRDTSDVERLLGSEEARLLGGAQHMPSSLAKEMADGLAEKLRAGEIDGFAFLQMDRELNTLIDHLGGCERILKTPMPRVHAVKLRRFILLYLVGLPYAVATSSLWVGAAVSALVAYPMLGIDRIGQELENPFSEERASHLPLDTLCATIEGNVLALARAEGEAPTPAPAEGGVASR